MAKAWQGRFEGPTDKRVELFTESISFDKRLYQEDIDASCAHAQMLSEVGLISVEEAQSIHSTLRAIGEEINAGAFPFSIEHEDIHLSIESELIRRVGDTGRKLHTGRSRNDQVSTDLRLWVRRRLDGLDEQLKQLQQALLKKAETNQERILPAYTHLQRAQPVLASHYFLAYVEKYQRDRERIADCRKRVNVLSLGCAAVAGSSLPLDRHRVADILGFVGVAANSMDVSSDRDFVLETLFVLTVVSEHLSAWAEEWILWSTTEFGFLHLSDGFCTGSSIMPQKKNPDVLELIRGKTARVIGSLQTLLVLVKGLPLAYNRDLQEDKQPLFDAMDTVEQCVNLAAAVIETSDFNHAVIDARLHEGFLDATTLMEQLIQFGVPMRTAHEVVGRLVRDCIAKRITLSEVSTDEYERIAPGHGTTIRGRLGVKNAVAAFVTYGSTAPAEVRTQVERWKKRLG